MQLHDLTHRNELGRLLNDLSLLGQGAEVGVYKAENAAEILNTWRGQHLWLVDSYAAQDPVIYCDVQAQSDYTGVKEAALKRIEAYRGRFTMIKKLSIEAAQSIPDGALDFVYIDANHSAEAVEQDLLAWHPKVKKGGILGGHDFVILQDATQNMDVVTPVLRFVYAHKLKLFVSPCTSWWVQL